MDTGSRGDKAARRMDSPCRPLHSNAGKRFRRMRDHMIELVMCCACSGESVDELSDFEEALPVLQGPLQREKTKRIPDECPDCTAGRPASNEPPAAPRHSTAATEPPLSAFVQESTGRGSMFNVADLFGRTQGGEAGDEDVGTDGSRSFELGVDEVLATPRLLRVEQSFADMALRTLSRDRSGWAQTNPSEHDKLCAGFKQVRLALKRVLAEKKRIDECEDDGAVIWQRGDGAENGFPESVPMKKHFTC